MLHFRGISEQGHYDPLNRKLDISNTMKRPQEMSNEAVELENIKIFAEQDDS